MKNTQDLSGSFFDLQDARLTKLKDPLVQLGEVVDWEAFHPLLVRIRPTGRKSNAGAPRRDEALMFKGLVIQHLYGLSDEQLEYQIEDRRSFQRFLYCVLRIMLTTPMRRVRQTHTLGVS